MQWVELCVLALDVLLNNNPCTNNSNYKKTVSWSMPRVWYKGVCQVS